MKMGTCDLCQTKGPIEPCEFCGANACSSDRTWGVCADDHEHLMQWCMDCEEILAKQKRAYRLVCRECSSGDDLPAALEHDINRRWKKKNQKPTGTITQSDLRKLMWNTLELMQDFQHAGVVDLDIDDFVYSVEPHDMIEDFDVYFPALQSAMIDLDIEISIEEIGAYDSGSIMINWSDDFDDILDEMSNF